MPLSVGVSGLSRTGRALRTIIREVIHDELGGTTELTIEGPPVVPAEIVRRADYLAGFPHLLGVVESFTGNRREHLALLDAVRDGGDWTTTMTPTELVLAPAACHSLYHVLADTAVDGVEAEVHATCFRREPSEEPTRFQTFDMLEYVYVGDAAATEAFAASRLGRAERALRALGLEPTRDLANDPFFGVAAPMLAAEQRATEAKVELLVDGPAGRFAVASVNRHGEHFGASFGITHGGETAHSACTAFGIHRLMLAVAAAGTAASRSHLDAARDTASSRQDRVHDA